ncbi:MAG: MerR family transcriptional regulator [Bacteroidota bacterium]
MSKKKFSISDLEKFSGVKAHTIRVWEQRHKVFKPLRNNGIRFYEITDLDKILKLALLNKNGYRISSICNFTQAELDIKLHTLPTDEDQQERILSQLFVYMYAIEPVLFEELLNTALRIWPSKIVLQTIILPFLQRTGLLWTGNRLSEEHFVVTVLRKKIIHAIETLTTAGANGKRVLLFLPEGRQLDIGLLYTNYLLKQKGMCVLYMGTDVSVKNLEQTLRATTPQVVFTYLPQKNNFDIITLAKFMEQTLPQSKLIIGQYQPYDVSAAQSNNYEVLVFEEAVAVMLAEQGEDITQHFSKKEEAMFSTTHSLY